MVLRLSIDCLSTAHAEMASPAPHCAQSPLPPYLIIISIPMVMRTLHIQPQTSPEQCQDSLGLSTTGPFNKVFNSISLILLQTVRDHYRIVCGIAKQSLDRPTIVPGYRVHLWCPKDQNYIFPKSMRTILKFCEQITDGSRSPMTIPRQSVGSIKYTIPLKIALCLWTIQSVLPSVERQF